MKLINSWIFVWVLPLLPSCVDPRISGLEHPSGTGPFDERGYYVEAWADNPAKWRGGDRKPTPSRHAVASNTRAQQPSNASQRPTQTAQNRPSAQQPQTQTRPQPKVTRYTVKSGDTLSHIAARHKTSVVALRRANHLTSDLIRIGQVLKIP